MKMFDFFVLTDPDMEIDMFSSPLLSTHLFTCPPFHVLTLIAYQILKIGLIYCSFLRVLVLYFRYLLWLGGSLSYV